MTTSNPISVSGEVLLARLDALDRKLDALQERQQWSEDLVEEMKPIAGLVMGSAIERLEALRARGLFDMLEVAGNAFDHVLDSYSKDDAERLSDALVGILDTVRHLTQPGVLQLADEAGDLLSDPTSAEPLGLWGVMRRVGGDPEVRRGLGIMVELLRAVGRSRAIAAGPVPARPTAPKAIPARSSKPAEGASSQASAPKPGASAEAAQPPSDGDIVRWEGVDFYANGFLVDPSAWTPELGAKIARGLGIELGDEHRLVIDWVRADFASTGASPNVRRIASGSGVGTEAMYRLFPPTPGKTCAMIAGVSKPVGCV